MDAPVNNVLEGRKIRTLLDNRIKAVRAKDVEGAVAASAADVLFFDVVTSTQNPLQYLGRDTARKRTEEWFSSFEGPLCFELRDLTIDAGDDVAFSRSLNRVLATTKDGSKLDMWWRSTMCYRKIDGHWIVTHEHNSVPFDPGSGKAALNLEP